MVSYAEKAAKTKKDRGEEQEKDCADVQINAKPLDRICLAVSLEGIRIRIGFP